MHGQIIKDWTKLDINKPKDRKIITSALQFFCAIPDPFIPARYQGTDKVSKIFQDRHKAYREMQAKQLQAFTVPGDMPTSVLPIVDTVTAVPYYDNGYEQIFQVINFAGSNRGGFRMINIQSGLTFRKIDIGETLDVFALTGTDTECRFDLYGGALGWHKTLFDDREYVQLEDLGVQFRNVSFNQRASVFYALIEAVGTSKGCCAWVTPHVAVTDPLYFAIGDALTLNYMAETILTRIANKGYGVTPQNASFVILCPIGLVYRMRQALTHTLQAMAGSGKTISYNFTIIASLLLSSASRVYVILPRQRMKAGYRMDLTLYSDFDLLSYTEVQAGWMRYGGCVGDSDQIECVDLEPISGSCPPSAE